MNNPTVNAAGDKTWTATIDGKQYSIQLCRTDSRKSKAFVFGPGSDIPETELEQVAKKVSSSTIYSKRGDYPELDKAWDVFNRQIIAAKRAVLEQSLTAIGFSLSDIKANFSRKAGCSCGCSPGFNLSSSFPGYLTLYINEEEPERDRYAEDVAERRAGC